MRAAILVGLAVMVGTVVDASSVSSYACGACMMLVNEIEADIAKVDPKKTIESGSYRVNPNGDQKGIQKVSFARSHTHLTDLLENVCTKSKEYQRVVNPKNGKSIFVNKASTYLKGVEDARIQSKLQAACNDFVDSYEDEIFNFHKTAHVEPVREFCHQRLGTCTSVDVSPLPPNEPEEDNVEEGLNDEL